MLEELQEGAVGVSRAILRKVHGAKVREEDWCVFRRVGYEEFYHRVDSVRTSVGSGCHRV